MSRNWLAVASAEHVEIGLNYLMCAPLSRDTFRLLADEVLPRL